MTEENTEIIDATIRLIKIIFSKGGFVGMFFVALVMGSGTSFIGASFIQPTNVEVTTPEIDKAVKESLVPIQEIIKFHTLELGHSQSILAIDRLQINIIDIRKSMQRQEEANIKTADNLVKTSETLNRLAGQVEVLVNRMP